MCLLNVCQKNRKIGKIPGIIMSVIAEEEVRHLMETCAIQVIVIGLHSLEEMQDKPDVVHVGHPKLGSFPMVTLINPLTED